MLKLSKKTQNSWKSHGGGYICAKLLELKYKQYFPINPQKTYQMKTVLSITLSCLVVFILSAHTWTNESAISSRSESTICLHDYTSVEQPYRCSRCDGSGYDPQIRCRYCEYGRRQVRKTCPSCYGKGYYVDDYGYRKTCYECGGKRTVIANEYCTYCNGRGFVKCQKCGGSGQVRQN